MRPAFFLALFALSGCITPTYEERLRDVDALFTQGRYEEAEAALAAEAGGAMRASGSEAHD